MTQMSTETEKNETLDVESAHAFCPICVPWTGPLAIVMLLTGQHEPEYIEGLCGAVVLSCTVPTAEEPGQQDVPPPNACRECLEATACPKCGQRISTGGAQ